MNSIRYIEDGLKRLINRGFTPGEAAHAFSCIQKRHDFAALAWRTRFILIGGSESEWEEACKDFLEGYSLALIVARFGTATPYADHKFHYEYYRNFSCAGECDEPIIVGKQS